MALNVLIKTWCVRISVSVCLDVCLAACLSACLVPLAALHDLCISNICISVDLLLELDEERLPLYPHQAIPVIVVQSKTAAISQANVLSVEGSLTTLVSVIDPCL